MSEEIKEEIVLDSPLVVHKKTDASYQAVASELEMNDTLQLDDEHTLERHRFKREKKSGSGKRYFFVLIVVIAIAVVSALYLTGAFDSNDNTTTTTTTTTEATTTLQQKYVDTILVKNTYIFVDGVEVNGIEGLQDALKYEDATEKHYTIIKENANTNFFNYEVLSILESMGFYTEDTVITNIQSSGLVAVAETTTKTTTTTPPTILSTTQPATNE